MEDIDDIDYRHGNNVFNKFKLNNLGDYHNLYVQSDTVLLADVFENFRDMCLKEYEQNKLIEQNKLLEQQNEQKKLIEQQNDELNKLLEQQKQEEDIDWDQINELSRKANEMIKNIKSRSPTSLRTFAPRRDPFDDISKNKKKKTASPSKIPAPMPKSLEPQGVAPGEQASIAIIKLN